MWIASNKRFLRAISVKLPAWAGYQGVKAGEICPMRPLVHVGDGTMMAPLLNRRYLEPQGNTRCFYLPWRVRLAYSLAKTITKKGGGVSTCPKVGVSLL